MNVSFLHACGTVIHFNDEIHIVVPQLSSLDFIITHYNCRQDDFKFTLVNPWFISFYVKMVVCIKKILVWFEIHGLSYQLVDTYIIYICLYISYIYMLAMYSADVFFFFGSSMAGIRTRATPVLYDPFILFWLFKIQESILNWDKLYSPPNSVSIPNITGETNCRNPNMVWCTNYMHLMFAVYHLFRKFIVVCLVNSNYEINNTKWFDRTQFTRHIL